MANSTAVLSIGSNCGDKQGHVRECMDWLMSHSEVNVSKCSHIYETPELHGKGTPYCNAVVEITTGLTLEKLTELTKDYEILCGRDCDCRKQGLVPIDVDVVIWNGKIIRPKDFACEFFRIGFSVL